MVQKTSILNLADKCTVFSGNTFHIYKGFNHKFGLVGNFVKFSSRLVSTSTPELKGDKFVGILPRLTRASLKCDGSFYLTKHNSVISLKKRLTPRGKELLGPVDKKVQRKKFVLSFSGIF